MTSSFYSLLTIVTDVGDAASLLAITAAGSLYLLSRSSGRAAMFLISSLLLSAAFIGMAKLAFLGCRSYLHHPNIHSPSGHAALSAAVFWAYAILMRSQLEARRRTLPMLLFTLLIIAIAISRAWLGFHTLEEVVIGLVIGVTSLFITRFLVLRGRTLTTFDAYALALWAVVAAFIAHGTHLPAENLIHMLASRIKSHVAFCGA